MNYTPNTIHWHKGAIVIHDAGAKEPKMLMRVIGYTRDGLCKTQYISKQHKRTIWKNRIAVLHDPTRFDLISHDWDQRYLESYQYDFEDVRRWNYFYKPGTEVKLTSADGKDIPIAKTTSKAFLLGAEARVWIQPGGMWSLRFVVATTFPKVTQVSRLP